MQGELSSLLIEMTTQTYFINLDRAPSRREHMLELFATLDLTAERIPAVDGRLLTEEFCRSLNPIKPNNRLLTPGEIGCLLSHRGVWQKIASAEAPFGLVFEDDVVFSKDVGKFLKDLSWVPSDVDFVKLDACHLPVELGPDRAFGDQERALRYARTVMIGTAGYLISKRCAQQLLERTTELRDAADTFMFEPRYKTIAPFEIWQLYPAICGQALGHDVTEDQRKDFEQSGLADERILRNRRTKRTNKLGWAKLWREIVRPIRKARLRPRDLLNRLWWKTTFCTVPFR